MNTQAVFKDYQAYRQWLSHWRKQYQALTIRILQSKDALKHEFRPNGMSYRDAQAELANVRMAARSLMIARTTVDAQYKLGKHNQQVAANIANIKAVY